MGIFLSLNADLETQELLFDLTSLEARLEHVKWMSGMRKVQITLNLAIADTIRELRRVKASTDEHENSASFLKEINFRRAALKLTTDLSKSSESAQ